VEQAIFEGTLRRSVTAIDANLPVFEVRTMEERLFESVAKPRFRTVLLGVFAGLALLMAVVGLYAVMAVSVAQRTHDRAHAAFQRTAQAVAGHKTAREAKP